MAIWKWQTNTEQVRTHPAFFCACTLPTMLFPHLPASAHACPARPLPPPQSFGASVLTLFFWFCVYSRYACSLSARATFLVSPSVRSPKQPTHATTNRISALQPLPPLHHPRHPRAAPTTTKSFCLNSRRTVNECLNSYPFSRHVRMYNKQSKVQHKAHHKVRARTPQVQIQVQVQVPQ